MPIDEEKKAIRYICKHTGLTGVEAKHIYDALQKTGTISVYDIDWEQAISPAREYGNRYEAVWKYLRELYGISKPLSYEEIRTMEEEFKEQQIRGTASYLKEEIEKVLSEFEEEEREKILEELKESLKTEKEREEEEKRFEEEMESIKRERERREKQMELEKRIKELERKLSELLEKKEKMEATEKSGLANEVKEELEVLNPEFLINVITKDGKITIVGNLIPGYEDMFHPQLLEHLPVVVEGPIEKLEKLKESFTKYIAENRLTAAPTAEKRRRKKRKKEEKGEEEETHKGYYQCWVCGYTCSPERAKELNYICPKCGAPLHPIGGG